MRTNFIDAPWFVYVSGGYNREPYKNGRTNQGAIWGVEWCGPKDHVLDGRLDLTHGHFGGDMLWHAQTYWQSTCLLLFAAVMWPLATNTVATCIAACYTQNRVVH